VTWTIDQVRRWLLPDEDKASWIDATGTLQVIERPLPAIWAGRPLAGLTIPGRFTLISVTRGGSARLDCNELVGQDSDMLQFAVSTSAADELDELLEGGGR